MEKEQITQTQMKLFKSLLFVLLLFLFSCGSSDKVLYLQDISSYHLDTIIQKYELRISEDDLLSIIVSSRNPELVEPFNLRKLASSSNFSNDNELGFLVDSNGNIDYPVLGKIKVVGLSRSELQDLIKNELIEQGHIKDPIVTIQFLNFKISVLGEVNRPGNFKISGNRVTLFEALSLAGDLTIYGKRDRIIVVREKGGKRMVAINDIRSSEILNSPYYYLQQNDIVYVEPNNTRAQQSGINQNMSVSAVVSVLSLLTSVSILIFK